MKRALCLGFGLLAAGCSNPGEGEASGASATMPKPGRYRITLVQEVIGSPDPKKEETSERCLTSGQMSKYHAALAGDPEVLASCRDLKREVGPGRFSVRMTCDTIDRDLINLPSEIRGTYSAESFEIIEEVTVVGVHQRDTKRYRRLGDC